MNRGSKGLKFIYLCKQGSVLLQHGNRTYSQNKLIKDLAGRSILFNRHGESNQYTYESNISIAKSYSCSSVKKKS